MQRISNQNKANGNIPTWTEGSPSQWQLPALHRH